MKSRFYDHIDLRVKNLARATRFYKRVLPAIGFTRYFAAAGWRMWQTRTKHPRPEFFGFTHDAKHKPGATRIAFWADTRAEVDRVAAVVRKAGGKKIEGPEICVDYSPNYYAIFFEDPDGNKLEVCCRLPLKSKRKRR